MKGKTWTPATLKEVGGTEGIGVTFLEEKFAALTAPPQHRLHQKAAQAVLKALLPEAGTDIKGHMRSQQDLLEASGYFARPKDFDALLRILDSEIRLITPTDPEGIDSENAANTKAVAGERYYQLTHDYLVHSLRDWLTRKQKETRRGRAELFLADRAAGYRLPTEAEMEYAIRAGAGTSRYYGETDELLGNYAWYTKNSGELLQRVGTKKPNDFGLFDVQGNCFTWCQEPYDSYPKAEGEEAVEDKAVKELMVISTGSRVMRGGSFSSPASYGRSAYRTNYLPSSRIYVFGFRSARTFTP